MYFSWYIQYIYELFRRISFQTSYLFLHLVKQTKYFDYVRFQIQDLYKSKIIISNIHNSLYNLCTVLVCLFIKSSHRSIYKCQGFYKSDINLTQLPIYIFVNLGFIYSRRTPSLSQYKLWKVSGVHKWNSHETKLVCSAWSAVNGTLLLSIKPP